MASSGFQAIRRQTLYVQNFPWTVGLKELREYFSQFGPVLQAKIIFDKDTGLNLGRGFITFKTEDAVQTALSMPNPKLEGKTLFIKRRDN